MLKLHFVLSAAVAIVLATIAVAVLGVDAAYGRFGAMLTHVMIAVWIAAGWFYWRAHLLRRKAAALRS